MPQLLQAIEEGVRRYDVNRHAHLARDFGGHDPGVCALVTYARGLSLRGLTDQARSAVDRALLLAETLSHPPSIPFGHALAGHSFMMVRDRHSCERMGARTVALAEKFDLPYYHSFGRFLMGWAKAQGLTLSEGLALMEEEFPHIATEQHYKLYAAPLAEARFDVGHVTDALALVDHALKTGANERTVRTRSPSAPGRVLTEP